MTSIESVIPPEHEFFERGFALSANCDPDEYLDYVRAYDRRKTLSLSFSYGVSVKVEMRVAGEIVASVEVEPVESVEFQGWHSDKIVRMKGGTVDVRVHYSPQPKLHVSYIAGGV